MNKLRNFLFSNSNTRQIIVKNTFWLFAGEISGRVFKMLLVVYAARNLGAEGWGTFSYTLSIAALFMIFSDIGIDDLITRELSQKKADYRIRASAALALKAITLTLGAMLVIFVGPIISNIPEAKSLFWLVAIILVFDAVRNNSFAINRVSEKLEKETAIKVITNALIFLMGYLLIKTNPAPTSLAVAYAVGGTIGAVLILGIVRKSILQFLVKIDRTAIEFVFKTVMPFTVIALMGSILANTDIFMLGLWNTTADIGMYAAVQRFYQFIAVLPAIITTATLPLMSRLAVGENEKLKTAVEKILTVFMMVGIPIAVGGIILAPEIVLLTFGPGYLQAIPVFKIILIMSLAAFPTLLFVNTIFVYNKQHSLIPINMIAVTANVFLNFLLIPKFGPTGAALATLASTWIIACVTWYKMKEINDFKILPSIKAPMVPVVGMLLITLILKYTEINVIVNIIISAIMYFALLFLIKRKTFADLKEIIGMQTEV